MNLVEFKLFESILYLGLISDLISVGFNEFIMQTDFRQCICCNLLTYSTVFMYVCMFVTCSW